MLGFSKDKLLRKQVGDKLSEHFIDFVVQRLTPESQKFVRQQFFTYATKQEIFQSTREIFYSLIEELDLKINTYKNSSAGKHKPNLIPLKNKKKKSTQSKRSGVMQSKAAQKKAAKNKKVKNQKAANVEDSTSDSDLSVAQILQKSNKAGDNNNWALKKKTSTELDFDPETLLNLNDKD